MIIKLEMSYTGITKFLLHTILKMTILVVAAAVVVVVDAAVVGDLDALDALDAVVAVVASDARCSGLFNTDLLTEILVQEKSCYMIFVEETLFLNCSSLFHLT
jgi:hypothetical protein